MTAPFFRLLALILLAAAIPVIPAAAAPPALLGPDPSPSFASGAGLPVLLAQDEWHPLAQGMDADLTRALTARLAGREPWRSLIRADKTSIGLVDLRDPRRVRCAEINGDVMLYAASLPKIAVLLTAFQAMEDGLLEDSPAVREDLTKMIRFSNNAAASRMIDRVGLGAIERVMRDPRYGLFDDESGGLWVGKRYAKTGPRRPDPVSGLVHGATARQVCRFYYLLATGRLVSPERSREMLGILARPGVNHKFVRSLRTVAPDARLYRKSGTWRAWHSDSVLVWGKDGRRYVLVALVEHPDGERLLRDLVPVAEDVLGIPAAVP